MQSGDSKRLSIMQNKNWDRHRGRGFRRRHLNMRSKSRQCASQNVSRLEFKPLVSFRYKITTNRLTSRKCSCQLLRRILVMQWSALFRGKWSQHMHSCCTKARLNWSLENSRHLLYQGRPQSSTALTKLSQAFYLKTWGKFWPKPKVW